MNNITSQIKDWINLLRGKASEFEYTARKNGKIVAEPSIDEICNQMECFLKGFNAEHDFFQYVENCTCCGERIYPREIHSCPKYRKEKQIEDKIAENIIVDLYEMRASTIKPAQARQMEKVEDLFRYQFFSVVIAKLYDKYKIKHEDIEKIIRERSVKENLAINNFEP